MDRDDAYRRLAMTSLGYEDDTMLAYVGGYTSADRDGHAPGITVYRVGEPGTPWAPLQTLPTETDNPSLLHLGPDGTRLYAVHGARTVVSAYAVNPSTGHLSPLNTADSGGLNPVDLGVWPGTQHLAVANYSAGTVALLTLAPDGSLGSPTALTLHRDGHPGPSLPHGVTFDPSGRFLLIPDKGLDCVWLFTCGPNGDLVPAGSGISDPGSGPRHCAFHPTLPMLYVVNELACSVQCFHWEPGPGTLAAVQTVSTLPENAGPGFAAEIAVSQDGRSVYASTRGHDSIAHFTVDPATGYLAPAHCTPCAGKEPRFFALSPDGHTLHVANQTTDQIVSFPLDADGRMGEGRVSADIGSPTTICFSPHI